MFRKIIASLVFTVFVVASVPFFLGLTLGKTFLSRSFYRETLVDAAYQPLSDYVIQRVRQIDPIFETSFSKDDLRVRFERHFSPELLQQIADRSLDQFHRDIDADSNPKKGLRVSLDLSLLLPASQAFFGELAEVAFANIPVCAEGIEPTTLHIFPNCKLAAWQTDAFQNKFEKDFQNLYQDKMLARVAGVRGDFSYDFDLGVSKDSYLSSASTLQALRLYVGIFLVAFTILMLFLWVKTWDVGFRWIGMMWMTSAVLGGLTALFLLVSRRFISPAFFGLSEGSPQYGPISELFQSLSGAFLVSYVFFLAFAFVLGFCFFMLARRFEPAVDQD